MKKKRKGSYVVKKFLSILAAAVLCAACLASCNDSSSKADTSASTDSSSSAVQSEAPADSGSQEESSEADESKADPSEADSSKTDESSESQSDDAQLAATITIDVSDILENYDTLEKGLQSEEFVPKSGKIIDGLKLEFTEGQTAYDLLKKAASDNNIKLEAQNTDYGIYIYGINSIVSGSCGQASGWMFSVNGKSPDVGADSYKLQAGDKVEFFYTCDFNKLYATQDAA